MWLPGLFPLMSTPADVLVLDPALCERTGERITSVRSQDMRVCCVSVRVRMTCVHRQSLTFRDLCAEQRPYCTPYTSLSLPSSMHPRLSPSNPSSSPARRIDAFCARARARRTTCVYPGDVGERASAPGVAAINTNWCICACSFRIPGHSNARESAIPYRISRYFFAGHRELRWGTLCTDFPGKAFSFFAKQNRNAIRNWFNLQSLPFDKFNLSVLVEKSIENAEFTSEILFFFFFSEITAVKMIKYQAFRQYWILIFQHNIPLNKILFFKLLFVV